MMYSLSVQCKSFKFLPPYFTMILLCFVAAERLGIDKPISLALEDGAEVDEETYDEFITTKGFVLHVHTSSFSAALSPSPSQSR